MGLTNLMIRTFPVLLLLLCSMLDMLNYHYDVVKQNERCLLFCELLLSKLLEFGSCLRGLDHVPMTLTICPFFFFFVEMN